MLGLALSIATAVFAGAAIAIFWPELIRARQAVDAYRARQKSRRQIRASAPARLALLEGALQSGLTLDQALTSMIDETSEDVRQVLQGRLGRTGALLTLDQRIERLFEGEDERLVRVALKLGARHGGGPSAAIQSARALLAQRERMIQKIDSLSAQGKLTAWIVAGAPVILFGVLHFVSPELVRPLFQSEMGIILIAAAAAFSVLGLVVVHRMVRLDL